DIEVVDTSTRRNKEQSPFLYLTPIGSAFVSTWVSSITINHYYSTLISIFQIFVSPLRKKKKKKKKKQKQECFQEVLEAIAAVIPSHKWIQGSVKESHHRHHLLLQRVSQNMTNSRSGCDLGLGKPYEKIKMELLDS
ncbi:hypothetical protein CMV_026272, partial [Castanea mollissima]